MTGLDIWMRENALTYVWVGSYLIALIVFAVEIAMVRHKRQITLQQIRLMQGVEYEDEEQA